MRSVIRNKKNTKMSLRRMISRQTDVTYTSSSGRRYGGGPYPGTTNWVDLKRVLILRLSSSILYCINLNKKRRIGLNKKRRKRTEDLSLEIECRKVSIVGTEIIHFERISFWRFPLVFLWFYKGEVYIKELYKVLLISLFDL